MEPAKTGALIKALRKEKGMTQKELADLLHITDRAVSKWERGLCAPDIALLEPLAKILGVSILELVREERAEQGERTRDIEADAKNVIDYSKREITRKTRAMKKTYLIILSVCLAALLAACGLALWRSGALFVIDQSPSPDGSTSATVYRKALSGGGFSWEDATSLIVKKGEVSWRITYRNCSYQGLWWAPDSQKYVISLRSGGSNYLALAWLERNVESNLSAYLSMGVEMSELRKYGYASESGDIQYQFLQWGLDSASMLIYYTFEDESAKMHDGYFWYNCESGAVSAVLELN